MYFSIILKKTPENEGLDGLHTNEILKLKSMGFRGLFFLYISNHVLRLNASRNSHNIFTKQKHSQLGSS